MTPEPYDHDEVLVFTDEELTETCVQFAALMGWIDDAGEAAWRQQVEGGAGTSEFYLALKDARCNAVEKAGGLNSDVTSLTGMGLELPLDGPQDAHVFRSDEQVVIACVEFIASMGWFDSIDVAKWGRQIMAGERGSAFRVRLIDVLHEAVKAVEDAGRDGP